MRGCMRALVLSAALWMVLSCSAGASAPQEKSAPKGGLENVEAILDETVAQLWKQTDEHWHEGEYVHIVNICKVVAAARPNMMEAYANAGWLLWSMDRDEEAVALYEQGLKANPDSYSMYDELGFYYYNRKKDYPRAIPYYEKAVAFKDCASFTLHMLAHAYERTKQMDKALKMWERAAAIPNNTPAKVNLARVKRLMKQS
jgi:tetratricopeptide (TPR) repeat protein